MSGLRIRPSRQRVAELLASGNTVSVYAELPNDLETPVSAYLRLAGDSPSFLLESVEGGERVARYSYLGVQIREAFLIRGHRLQRVELRSEGPQFEHLTPVESDPEAVGANPLNALRREMARFEYVPQPELPEFPGGLVGYTGYDVVRNFEHLPTRAKDTLGLPDAVYLVVRTLLAYDHAWQRLLIIANLHVPDATAEVIDQAYEEGGSRIRTLAARLQRPLELPAPNLNTECTPPAANLDLRSYLEMVETAKEHIRAGDIFQVVLSRRFSKRTMVHPFAIYRALRQLNPSPWMFYVGFGRLAGRSGGGEGLYLVGSSPEMHARFENTSRIATVTPIAGTRTRGATEADDRRLAEELLADPKERAEHLMLVDLGRNDLGRIAEPGTVEVKEFMQIERYSHVMHIVSRVECRVADGWDALDVLQATFPAGTLTGAPKIRAMEIVEELERERRGPYGGCTGWISFGGDMGTCITIRTIVMTGDRVYVQSGGGVVADSDPRAEFEETVNKARVLLKAIAMAEADLL